MTFYQQAEAILDAADREGRQITADEERRVDDLMKQAERQTLLIKASAPIGEYTPTLDITHDQGAVILAGEPRSYQAMYGKPQKSQWRSGEFMRCVLNGWHDPRLQFMAAMGESSGAGGGLLVPSPMEQMLLDRALHQSIVMARANIKPMTSKTVDVAGFAATDQSNTLYGMTFNWLSENETVTPGTGQVRAVKLEGWTAGIYLSASNELVADSPGFETELMTRLGDAVAESLDYYFINGDGVGKPLGYLNSDAVIAVDAEAGQAADTLVVENILKMFSRSTNPMNSVWVANPGTITELGKMYFTVGADSFSGQTALQQSGGMMTMLGRPVLFTSRAPVLGEQGDITFADLSQYMVGLRQGVGVEASPHPGFTSNQMTFRCLVRVDGRPVTNTAYTGRDSITYSPFVALAAR